LENIAQRLASPAAVEIPQHRTAAMDAETKATATSAKEKRRCHPMKKAAPLARGARQVQSSNRRLGENTTPSSGRKSGLVKRVGSLACLLSPATGRIAPRSLFMWRE
jgi:hypothetical protein